MVCSICLEEITKSDLSKTTDCNHTYHTKCIDLWLIKDNSCPLCRSILQKKQNPPIPIVSEIIINIDEMPTIRSRATPVTNPEDAHENLLNQKKKFGVILFILFMLFSIYNITMIYLVNKSIGYEIIDPIYFIIMNIFIAPSILTTIVNTKIKFCHFIYMVFHLIICIFYIFYYKNIKSCFFDINLILQINFSVSCGLHILTELTIITFSFIIPLINAFNTL